MCDRLTTRLQNLTCASLKPVFGLLVPHRNLKTKARFLVRKPSKISIGHLASTRQKLVYAYQTFSSSFSSSVVLNLREASEQ